MISQDNIDEVGASPVNAKIRFDTKRVVALFVGLLIADIALFFIAKLVFSVFNSKRLMDIIYILIQILLSFYLIWYLKRQSANLGDTLRLRMVKSYIIIPTLLFSIGFVYIAIFGRNLLNLWLGSHSLIIKIDYIDIPSIITLMGIGLIIPFWEELTNRGLLSNALEPRYGKWAGILITSLIFAFFHYYPARIYFTFFLGIGLGWIASETGSIFPSLLIHALFNFSIFSERISSMGDEMFIERSVFTYEIIPIIMAIILFSIGLNRLHYYRKKIAET